MKKNIINEKQLKEEKSRILMTKEEFDNIIANQSAWKKEYMIEKAFRHKEKLIQMSMYKSRGNRDIETIEEQLRKLKRFI